MSIAGERCFGLGEPCYARHFPNRGSTMDPQDVHWATGGLHHEWLNILHSPTFSLSPFPSIIIVGGLQSLKLWWRFADRIFSFFTTTLRPYDRTSRCSRTTRSVNCIIRNSSYALRFKISEHTLLFDFRGGENCTDLFTFNTRSLVGLWRSRWRRACPPAADYTGIYCSPSTLLAPTL